jgi:hypothetical protein
MKSNITTVAMLNIKAYNNSLNLVRHFIPHWTASPPVSSGLCVTFNPLHILQCSLFLLWREPQAQLYQTLSGSLLPKSSH